MSTRVTFHLEDGDVAALDADVAAGRSRNRSHAIRRSIARLQREQRYRAEEVVMLDVLRRGESLYPDLWTSDGGHLHGMGRG